MLFKRLRITSSLLNVNYDQRCTATASKENHAAIILSYSGKATFLTSIVEVLHKKGIDIIWIDRVGTSVVPNCIKHCLYISDRENLRNRISQQVL